MGTHRLNGKLIENHIGTCPQCGEEMVDLDIEHHGREVNEGYNCPDCRIIVSYLWTLPEPSLADLRKRHDVSEREWGKVESAERWARDHSKIIIEKG
jgi:hypothetical protein